MPFENKTVMEQRLELVLMGSQPGANVSELCQQYNVSRRIFYKWLNRYRLFGETGLRDASKRPKSSPGQTDQAIEDVILSLRRENPEWGARKLKVVLERSHPDKTPSASTINVILQRNGLINPQKSLQHVPVQRFEYGQPNELWQMDFKGGFKMLDQSNCYPLTITDDHSRFNVCLSACTNQQSFTVREQLTAIFRAYGCRS
jgi:transposase-like protein